MVQRTQSIYSIAKNVRLMILFRERESKTLSLHVQYCTVPPMLYVCIQ